MALIETRGSREKPFASNRASSSLPIAVPSAAISARAAACYAPIPALDVRSRNQSRAGERWIRSVDGRPGERAIFRPDPDPWSFA